MIYRVLADLVLVLHLGFIAFVVVGGLLALRWRRAPLLHLPAALWGVAIELFGWQCPLAPLENALRRASGTSDYSGGFIEHYPGEVLATQDTIVIVLPSQTMVREIERHPVLAREILYAYGQRLHYIETLLLLSREPVEKRLVAALLYLYHKFGFTLPLTRAEIGAMAFSPPPPVMGWPGR